MATPQPYRPSGTAGNSRHSGRECAITPRMDLLLAHGYFLAEDAHEQKVMKPYPTLGLLYLSSYLKSKGYAIGVFDATFQKLSDFKARLEADRPPVVGL